MSETFDITHDTEASAVGDDSLVKRRDALRKKDARKDRKDKGYIMFEEEDTGDELMADDMNKSPTKAKKHVKSTFKFPKKDKVLKLKEKEKEDRKEKENKDKADKDREKKEKLEKVEKDKAKERTDKFEKEKKEKGEKIDKERDKKDRAEKDQKKEEDSKIKFKKKQALSVAQVIDDVKPLFGIPLAAAVERSPCHDGVMLPVVVRECIDYIEEFGLTCEGIYRISGVKSKVQSLKDAYNKAVNVCLMDYEPNVIASLLKQFLRELPEPVLTAKLMPKFEQASTIKNVKQKVEQCEVLLNELPQENRVLLSWIIVHMMHVITLENENKMSLQNVSIVLSPTMQISHRVLNVFFAYSKILFRDTVIKKYVPPLKPVTSRWSLELPDSPSAIEEELKKQESLLNHLHEELMNVKDMNKEEQLWEVQRVVTQLKRKLKHAKQIHLSVECAKLREDEIMQDKTEQLQSVGHTAFRDKQMRLRMTSESLDESAEILSQELDQAVEIEESFDSTENLSSEENKDYQHVRSLPEAPSQNVLTANSKDVETKLDNRELTSVKHCIYNESLESQQPNEVSQLLVKPAGIELDSSAEMAEHKEAKPLLNDDENDSVSRIRECDVACSDEVCSQCDMNRSGINKDMPINRELECAEVTSSETVTDRVCSVETDTYQEKEPAPVENSIYETKTTVIKSRTEEPAMQTNTLSDSLVKRQSPTDDSSDAYTDVLDEETDHLSEILEKDQPEPSVYTELQDDLSAFTDSHSANRLTRIAVMESEVKRMQNPDAAEETEFDDIRPYSETTTSSEPSELEDGEEYEALEQENVRLMMEEEELLAIGDELKQKIRMEKREIERLHQDIIELRMIREDMSDSDHESSASSNEGSDSDDDDDDLLELLEKLVLENRKLEVENADLCDKIHQERQVCIAIKVESRMMQQQHFESSACGLDDCESLL